MRTAEEWANKFFLDYPAVYESHLIDDKCISYWFRRAQADTLRWAAKMSVGTSIGINQIDYANMLREKADAIEKGE